MARPTKSRRVCRYPDYWTFSSEEDSADESVALTLEEYESIRLIDLEGKTQAQCASDMNVARTTVTAIYDSARRKLADCLVNGRRLVISGGTYILSTPTVMPAGIGRKGKNVMRIAVTYENGRVYQHFGHTKEFKIYDVEGGKVMSSKVTDTNGQGHGALAGFLAAAGADTLICGGIGGGAQAALAEAGIKLYGGVTGAADEAVQALIDGKLDFDPDVMCSHHGEDHTCGHGEHAHGEYECGRGGSHKCGHIEKKE